MKTYNSNLFRHEEKVSLMSPFSAGFKTKLLTYIFWMPSTCSRKRKTQGCHMLALMNISKAVCKTNSLGSIHYTLWIIAATVSGRQKRAWIWDGVIFPYQASPQHAEFYGLHPVRWSYKKRQWPVGANLLHGVGLRCRGWAQKSELAPAPPAYGPQ